MSAGRIILLIALFFSTGINGVFAQETEKKVSSAADNLIVQPNADRTVWYNIADSGIYKPINWGLDLAWLDEVNVRRGIAFMGKENVDVIRSSFMPTLPLVGDTALQGEALLNTNKRIQIINKWLGASTQVVLNCDHPSVHTYFKGNAKNWASLINTTTKMHQKAGRKVVTVSPFNEPDYSVTGQGTIQDFYNIAVELGKNPRFDSIRISGGNTLNCDQALPWYNFLQSQLDEGNTHQLAGNFDNYASFYQTVRANGHHATNDELHNVMEAMVGVEYGLQTGIWWGTAELARGEFVKASDGKRLAYAEHRPNWTSASVYRNPDGKVNAFVGSSERQAATTTYSFISKDRDVFYDGNGPQREYVVEIPGGTGYQQGQTNAEKVVRITWGDDIQPVVDGKYILVNRNSGKVMEAAGGSAANGTNIQQNTYNGAAYQQWNVKPINPRNGGDFSYFNISGVQSGKHLDITNASLDNGGNLIMWEKGTWWDGRQSPNQVWFLEYTGDGWFHLRNQYSSFCLEVANNSTANAANIQQWEKDDGTNQQWRLIPVGAPVEFEAPAAPENLVATASSESVRLDWTANSENDIDGYTIFRADVVDGPYNTIARKVKTTAFVDNTCTEPGTYYYKIKATDKSLNSSGFSQVAEATTKSEHALVAHYLFNENTLDSSINLNHGATPEEINFSEGIVDSMAVVFNGTEDFVRLPATVANQQAITIAAWVFWNGGTPWQRIFEFGNNESEYMNLTPRLRFSIKNGGAEQRLDASSLPEGEWAHVAVTLGESGARMFLNGELVDESTGITIRPVDFKPVLNYIGRGITEVPMFNGKVDDFRIYNYELTTEEIAELVLDVTTDANKFATGNETKLTIYPVPADETLNFEIESYNNPGNATIFVYDVYGKLMLKMEISDERNGEIKVLDLPTGIYLLKLNKGSESLTKRISIIH
ncbi:MAG: RICIN domain-containing protein [Draconibacterium sp.]